MKMTIRMGIFGGSDWADGEVLYADDVNDTIGECYEKNVPVGSVMAWLKDYTSTPSLPNNWVECNGQTLSDAGSVYNGQVIPDLNSAVDTGLKGRFLRGHTASGVEEDSQNLAHTHTVLKDSSEGSGDGLRSYSSGSGTHTTSSSGGSEARPYNYSVVWIMKVR